MNIFKTTNFIIVLCMFILICVLWVAEQKYKMLKNLLVSATISLTLVIMLMVIKSFIPHTGLLNMLSNLIFIPLMLVPYGIAVAILYPFGLIGRGNIGGPLEGGVIYIIAFLFYTFIVYVFIRLASYHRKRNKY